MRRVDRLLHSVFVLGFAIAGLVVSTSSEARLLQLQDYLDWEWVADPKISPDGQTILYTRKRVNVNKDRYDTELWIMDAEGGGNRRLLDSPVSEVSWSPDSTRIAYIAKTESGSEIFVRWMDAQGGTTQVTQASNTPSNISWSPDGKSIAFRDLVPAESDWTISLPDFPAVNQSEGAVVIDKLHWQYDGVGIKPNGYKHIFVVPADGGLPKQVTEGEWHAGESHGGHDRMSGRLQWTPNGQSIVFSAYREGDTDLTLMRSSLYKVDIASNALRRITTSPDYVYNPLISPNGKWIAYLGKDNVTESTYPDYELHVIGIDGANHKILFSESPGYVLDLHWSPNSNGLYYVQAEEGSYNIQYVPLEGKTIDVNSSAQSVFLSSISRHGLAVGTRTTAEEPGDIVSLDLSTGKIQRLTAVNDDVLQSLEMGRLEEVWYDSTDNARIQGWIVYPPNFDPEKKYPLILDIHGGVEMMYSDSWHWTPMFSYQYWAAQGYVVLYTNPRGSVGYGGEFARAVYNAFPGRRDYQDLMRGVDHVIDRGIVDEERMYVQGCSAGGMLTAWVVTQTDRFSGAAALCPITNWISYSGAGDITFWTHNRFKEHFWDDSTAWLKHSPIMHVNKVKTPTLLMAGENDIRTPMGQAEEFYSALKILGVPTKLIIMKGENHGTWLGPVGRPSNFLRSQLYIQKWFSQWRRMEQNGQVTWQPPASNNNIHKDVF